MNYVDDAVVIMCPTNSTADDAPQHGLIVINRSYAERLIQMRNAYTDVAKHFQGLYCLEFWDGTPMWGKVTGYTKVDFKDVNWLEITDTLLEDHAEA